MLNLPRGRSVALAVCILVLLSIFSNLPSDSLPQRQSTYAYAKITSSTGGPEETQSISGPTIQDFSVNTTQCSAPVQWNYSLTDSYGLTNATFWWNNGTTDMGNTTYTFSSSPLSGNALFNYTLPATAQNVTFQFWAYNVYNWSTTGLRWMLVYPSNRSIPYFLNLGTAISIVDAANTWTGADTYLETVLSHSSTSSLNSLIDNHATSQNWVDVLEWSAICNKLGVTQQTDIKYALGNYTMVGNLPYTDNESGSPDFLVESTWALYGYYFNAQSWMGSYQNNTKWNVTAAYQQFNYSVANCLNFFPWEMPLFMFANSTAEGYSNRYYDEDACTIEDYVIFAELLNVSEALNDALYYWNYLIDTHWSDNYSGYFKYTPTSSEPCFECEAPFFLKIIADLKYYYPNLANWTKVLSDIGNRFLSNEWNSYQWSATAGVSTYVAVHEYIFQPQERLENTLGTWQALFAAYLQLNDRCQNNMIDMLNGNTNTQPAWELLLKSGLFYSSTDQFSYYSYVPPDQNATAAGEILLFLMGIVPGTTTIAYPIEQLNYEYVDDIDPALLQFNLTTRQIYIPVDNAGTLTFQYGCSPVTYYFNQSGIWQIGFTDSWNNIAKVQRLENLPDNVIYFQNIAIAPTHDVAAVGVTSFKPLLSQGYSYKIEVTVANEGTFRETFNVTVYANTTAISTQQISDLNAINQTTITFTWNTSGLGYGNYILSAYAWPVPNETNTANNNYTGAAVTVTIPGDLNGDLKVTSTDLTILTSSYGSKPGGFNWNFNADIDGNGVVGLSDLVILAQHYGQHYP